MTLEQAKSEQERAIKINPPQYIFYHTKKDSYFLANIDCRNEYIKLVVFKNGKTKLI